MRAVVLAIAVALTGATAAAAQTSPTAPVRVVVGVPAGGVLDPYARIVSEHMEKTLGRVMVIENKPGANGNLSALTVLDAPADGSAIWIGTQSMTEINPTAYSKLRWSMKDFVPIIKGVAAPLVLVTHPSVPAKTFPELIDYLKKNPGKLGYASFNPGTPSHFLGFQLNERFGLDLAHIPYKGSGQQSTDLVAGHALLGFSQLGSTMPHIASGKLNAIAVTGPERSRFLPDVPTFAELGYKIDFRGFVGLAAPAKTPKPVIDYLNKQVNAVVQTDLFKKRMGELGMSVPSAADNTPEKYEAYLRAEIVKQGQVAKLMGVTQPEAPK